MITIVKYCLQWSLSWNNELYPQFFVDTSEINGGHRAIQKPICKTTISYKTEWENEVFKLITDESITPILSGYLILDQIAIQILPCFNSSMFPMHTYWAGVLLNQTINLQ